MQKYISKYLFISVLLLGFASCDPEQDGAVDIGVPPAEASFTIEETGEINTYLLRSTTPGAFLFQWDLGNGTNATGETLEVKYPLMGTYEVTLTAFNKGGSASSSQNVNVAEDAPVDCDSFDELKFITNCESKVWRLIPEAGALFVGPDDGSGTTWFATSEDDVVERFCQFDDEWTFTVAGSMDYDTKGDIWGEDYLGFNFECAATADLGAAVEAWGDGSHIFVVTAGTDTAPAQLQVIGEGAFIGLPKATNGAEVGFPVNSTTYDIVRMETINGQDILEIEVNVGGDAEGGVWRFILASF
ncbi:MAG: PKD repeat protein [Paraglaciecola sp.]|jgi:PKD repeat protein